MLETSRAGLVVYPYGDNPYQDLLYRSLLEQHPGLRIKLVRSTSTGVLLFPLLMLSLRLRGYRLFHVHWPNLGLSYDSRMPFAKTISLYLSMFNIAWVKMIGYGVIWTVHNVLPHDPLTSDDRLVARCLAEVAAAKIVHSRHTIDQMARQGIDFERSAVIPHGNYIGVYPDRLTRASARNDLGIGDEVVVLFFGYILPYKGVEELVSAVGSINDPNVRLVIAGKCVDREIGESIKKSMATVALDYYEGYQSDEDVERFFKASDLVCLPFKSITTSGSALLALSFGRPIIAPRAGSLRDLPEDVGYFYSPHDAKALEETLRRAISNRDEYERLGRSGKRYAETVPWGIIAEETYKVYESALLG